jgi:hypothetical protein
MRERAIYMRDSRSPAYLGKGVKATIPGAFMKSDLAGSDPTRDYGFPRRVTPLLRLRVFFGRLSLNRQLAEGCAPELSPQLALRARQLTRPAYCRELALCLRSLVEEAKAPGRPAFSSAQPVQREALSVWSGPLRALADRLEEPEVVTPAAVARVLRLLTDGASPLFNPHADRLMGDMVWWVGEGFLANSSRERQASVAGPLA